MARELAGALAGGAKVIDFAYGSGRNAAFLSRRGFAVTAVPDDGAASFAAPEAAFDGAVSTHGLLHGTPAAIRSMLEALAHALKRGAPLYATFASTKDARYGAGRQIEAHTFAADGGEEAGVAHSYFDQARLRELLRGLFEVESMEECAAEHVAGSVHWSVRARRV